jgi:hypothetical protein
MSRPKRVNQKWRELAQTISDSLSEKRTYAHVWVSDRSIRIQWWYGNPTRISVIKRNSLEGRELIAQAVAWKLRQ